MANLLVQYPNDLDPLPCPRCGAPRSWCRSTASMLVVPAPCCDGNECPAADADEVARALEESDG